MNDIRGEIGERLDVLLRISVRAKNYYFSQKDDYGIDFMEHFQNELKELMVRLDEYDIIYKKRNEHINYD